MTDVQQIDSKTKHRIETSDKLFRLSLIGTLIVVIVMFSLLMVQSQINANKAVENAAKNHKRTQDYILCVAKALTVQIPDRTLDQCTQTVDNETKAVN